MASGVVPIFLTFLLVLSLLILYVEGWDRREGLVVVPGIGVVFLYVVLMEPYGFNF